jgi:thioredoxin 1
MANTTVTFTDENFQTEAAEGLVLVDFWAPWCGPCRMVGPIIEELAGDYDGQVKIGKLNVDDNQNTAMNFRVMSIPTVILFKDGQPVETMIGAQGKGAYQSRIEKYLQASVSS